MLNGYSAYLAVVLDEIMQGGPVDPEIYEQIKSTFTNRIDVSRKLGKIADNVLTPEETISLITSRLWLRQPEPARELVQFLSDNGDLPQGMVQGRRSNGKGNGESSEFPWCDYCFCNRERVGTLIFECDNSTCPREWFHLCCVNLIVVPGWDKSWFCSEVCEKMAKI